jgi:hypothetical protein
MTKVINSIAIFLAESPEWVENWMNTPVKKMSRPNIDFPDFVVSFFNNLPLEYFDTSYKLNRNWYKECRRELDRRRKACIKKYWATVEEYKEAKTAFDKVQDEWEKCFDLGILNTPTSNMNEIADRFCESSDNKISTFEDWADVDRAIIRCGFPDLIDHANPEYYINMDIDELDPYEIPTQEELEEEWGFVL